MATQIDNPFKTWAFDTEEEFNQAKLLPELTYKMIQNELAVVATSRALHVIDPNNTEKAMRELEYQRGQIEAFSYLLNMSDNATMAAIAILRGDETKTQQD